MYPYIRAGLAVLSAKYDPDASIFTPAVTHHRAWPWDTDMYGELNNGRILTLGELGRWGMARRVGLLRALKRRRAAMAIAGVSVRYRRRIPLFARYRIETRALGWDARFFYLDVSMWLGDLAANQALLRTAFVGRDGVIPVPQIVHELGHDGPSPALPDWVTAWTDAEATRPWPPISALAMDRRG
ncbi:MAG: acyl-CoA thioesterase [Pseudomonadota bacterium]